MATWVGCTVWWQHAHPLLASTRDCSHYSRSLAGMALYKFYATTTPLSPVNSNARAAVLCGRPCCCIRETVWHILCAPRSAHTHLYIVHHAAKILILISFSGLFSSPLSPGPFPPQKNNKTITGKPTVRVHELDDVFVAVQDRGRVWEQQPSRVAGGVEADPFRRPNGLVCRPQSG